MNSYVTCICNIFSELVCENGQVRLVDGFAGAGRVELCYDNLFGTVCHDRFEDDNAFVVCRQLGLPFLCENKDTYKYCQVH